MWVLDTRKLIKRMGGIAAVSRKLVQYELPMANYDAIKKWQQRGSMPADRVVQLFMIALSDEGETLDLFDFLRNDAEDGSASREAA